VPPLLLLLTPPCCSIYQVQTRTRDAYHPSFLVGFLQVKTPQRSFTPA
jgi:hypothetical protein